MASTTSQLYQQFRLCAAYLELCRTNLPRPGPARTFLEDAISREVLPSWKVARNDTSVHVPSIVWAYLHQYAAARKDKRGLDWDMIVWEEKPDHERMSCTAQKSSDLTQGELSEALAWFQKVEKQSAPLAVPQKSSVAAKADPPRKPRTVTIAEPSGDGSGGEHKTSGTSKGKGRASAVPQDKRVSKKRSRKELQPDEEEVAEVPSPKKKRSRKVPQDLDDAEDEVVEVPGPKKGKLSRVRFVPRLAHAPYGHTAVKRCDSCEMRQKRCIVLCPTRASCSGCAADKVGCTFGRGTRTGGITIKIAHLLTNGYQQRAKELQDQGKLEELESYEDYVSAHENELHLMPDTITLSPAPDPTLSSSASRSPSPEGQTAPAPAPSHPGASDVQPKLTVKIPVMGTFDTHLPTAGPSGSKPLFLPGSTPSTPMIVSPQLPLPPLPTTPTPTSTTPRTSPRIIAPPSPPPVAFASTTPPGSPHILAPPSPVAAAVHSNRVSPAPQSAPASAARGLPPRVGSEPPPMRTSDGTAPLFISSANTGCLPRPRVVVDAARWVECQRRVLELERQLAVTSADCQRRVEQVERESALRNAQVEELVRECDAQREEHQRFYAEAAVRQTHFEYYRGEENRRELAFLQLSRRLNTHISVHFEAIRQAILAVPHVMEAAVQTTAPSEADEHPPTTAHASMQTEDIIPVVTPPVVDSALAGGSVETVGGGREGQGASADVEIAGGGREGQGASADGSAFGDPTLLSVVLWVPPTNPFGQ